MKRTKWQAYVKTADRKKENTSPKKPCWSCGCPCWRSDVNYCWDCYKYQYFESK